MEEKQISGATEEEIWQQLSRNLSKQENLLQYRVVLSHGAEKVLLDIDIDLGGGFESGFATTILSAHFPNPSGFSFAVYPQHFTHTIGKIFGMQDVVVGDREFDDKLIVKTTDENRVKELFADAGVRALLTDLADFTFEITVPENPLAEDSALELVIEEGITNAAALREIYMAFTTVLRSLNR